MAIFDSLVVGEDFISEHFFRTDATKESFLKLVIDLEKIWKQDDEQGESSLTRFKSVRGELEKLLSSVQFDEVAESRTPVALAAIHAVLEEPYSKVRSALGYADQGLTTKKYETATESISFENVWSASSGESLVLEAKPVTGLEQLLDSESSALLSPVTRHKASGDVSEVWDVSRALSFIFRAENAPQYVLVIAGQWLLLAEQERWAEGRYLAVNLYLALQRNDQKAKGELSHLVACVGKSQLTHDAQQNIWWDQALEESVKHTVGVSSDLREGIRLSIEILANDVVKRLKDQGKSEALQNLDAQDLARQSLRYLYRILFLLYAEASPEMQVVPTNDPVYEEGYGLDRLRELILVDLHSPTSKNGTHIYESLNLLFEKVNQGYNNDFDREGEEPLLRFEPLEADLFGKKATALIDEAKLSNEQLQRVLVHLLMTKADKKKERGFISYAELGINQLGAVYEGLMSYTGFIAEELLYEVAKDGDASGGSWMVNEEKANQLLQEGFEKSFVRRFNEDTGVSERVTYAPGTFVFRLAGRERQQSASYYTPEVLTKFVVSQALEELITDETPADDLLQLNICEPALGSGAFVVEATRQLAIEYLKRKQKETGLTIDPEKYAEEFQKVKAQIALHQVYGVDLNSTAVELAEISLWLDTMNPGLHAPWFGLHLKRGNSLIGARRAVYTEGELVAKGGKKAPKTAYWNAHEPHSAPVSGLAAAIDNYNGVDVADPAVAGKVFQFLLPSDGWAAVCDSKPLKDSKRALDEQKVLKSWVAKLPKQFKKDDFLTLVDLSQRVEELWGITLQRMRVAEREASRRIDYFGAPEDRHQSTVQRAEIEAKLGEKNSAYQRLRRVMDAWCALWFWPVDTGEAKVRATQLEFDAFNRAQQVASGEAADMGGYDKRVDLSQILDLVQIGENAFEKTVKVVPPTYEQWTAALGELLGSTLSRKAKQSDRFTATVPSDWTELGAYEDEVLMISGAQPVDAVLAKYPWLQVCERIASEQGFFHWELDFAAVFARGGFDLQVGNPPWVRPRWDENAIMAEHHPWWQLVNKAKNADKERYVKLANTDTTHNKFFNDSATAITATSAYLSHPSTYSLLTGLQPDLYRAFMVKTWQNNAQDGVVSLIHPESHFTEKKAASLRSGAYHRLRRHYQFINELKLFEIHHEKPYGIHIYSNHQNNVNFSMAASLYHPDTVSRATAQGTFDFVPALKDENNNWDTRPHPERIITVDNELLETWASILDEPGTPADEARMVYAVNKASSDVLKKLSTAPRVRELGLQYSSGWHETADRKRNLFQPESKVNDSWSDAIIQGPFFSVANPFAKQPNESMKNNLDYTEIDLEALPADFIPRTSYQPVGSTADNSDYDKQYNPWMNPITGQNSSARSYFRLIWRRRAAITGVRTMYPSVVPPGTAIVNTVNSTAFSHDNLPQLMLVGGTFSSLLSDFFVKTSGVSDLWGEFIDNMPLVTGSKYDRLIIEKFTKLICLTSIFSDIWVDIFKLEWNRSSIPTKNLERNKIQCEIDALVALALNVSIEDLITVYKTQFSVLQQYDKSDLFDANGRKVPKDIAKKYLAPTESGSHLSSDERTWTHPQSDATYVFEEPFAPFDREAELRKAYEKYSR